MLFLDWWFLKLSGFKTVLLLSLRTPEMFSQIENGSSNPLPFLISPNLITYSTDYLSPEETDVITLQLQNVYAEWKLNKNSYWGKKHWNSMHNSFIIYNFRELTQDSWSFILFNSNIKNVKKGFQYKERVLLCSSTYSVYFFMCVMLVILILISYKNVVNVLCFQAK